MKVPCETNLKILCPLENLKKLIKTHYDNQIPLSLFIGYVPPTPLFLIEIISCYKNIKYYILYIIIFNIEKKEKKKSKSNNNNQVP
jgi:hypothetical protein